MNRRRFLKSLGVGALSPLALSLGACGLRNSDSPSSTNLTSQVSGETLKIPPLYEGEVNNQGVRVFKLSIAEHKHQFFHGMETATWAINSPGTNLGFLGPTLKLTRGEQVSIQYTNHLKETTTMHGHGMHVPAAMDGGPHQLIAPGETWKAEYVVKQTACTNWYHPHQMGKTAEHVYNGLAGFIIVEDETSTNLDLPKTYGVDDIPLVLQDRFFDKDGQLDYSPGMMERMWGYRGGQWLANGQIRPQLTAKAGLLRLRLLNGSNAGIYELSLDSGDNFVIIATDNSFLPNPVHVDKVLLSPGERIEVILDLQNKVGQQFALQVEEAVTGDQGIFLDIYVDSEQANRVSLPTSLASLDFLQETEAVHTRKFELGMAGMMQLGINGKQMAMDRIDEQIPCGEVEIWEITNSMMMPHNFHIHATHFIPLDRNGRVDNLKPWEKNTYKDTLYMPSGSSARILVKMTDYKDYTAPYMYHCHILEHEDGGMMGQFVVV